MDANRDSIIIGCHSSSCGNTD